ncbi:MAG: sigma-70 family RNA polymerase sigma factor [Gemmatimonadota bacterium]
MRPKAGDECPERGWERVSIDWNDLYRSTFPDLVRFLHRKVWDAERARDLAQEAFVRALTHEPRRPRAWLFQVAANLARDEARTVLRRKRHLVLLKGDAQARDETATDPATVLAAKEQWRSVRAALDSLSEKDRDALLLWDSGQSYSEIARQTGLAVGAVGTTLARARRRLADAYRAMERDDVARR